MAKNVKQTIVDAEDHEFEMREATHIPDGSHVGLIKNISYEKRNDFEYVDVRVTVDNIQDVTIKTGFPANISDNSSFGKFLISGGIGIVPGKMITMNDIRKALMDRKISYITYTEDVYARIINKSIKFLK